MSKLDDIITVLPCLALNKHNCGGCPYNPKPDRNWPYGCVRGQEMLVRDAIEALRGCNDTKTCTCHDEIEELKDRVYNMTLYIRWIEKRDGLTYNAMMREFSGMPGYCAGLVEEEEE